MSTDAFLLVALALFLAYSVGMSFAEARQREAEARMLEAENRRDEIGLGERDP